MTIIELLGLAGERGASDLHLAGGNPPILRVNGDLQRVDETVLGGDDVLAMVHEIMTEPQRALYNVEKEVDFSFELDAETRFRSTPSPTATARPWCSASSPPST
jgi:twitching motility protein PilT